MREDITSIPISEVFEPRDGCPLCRLRSALEERVVTYITGAAMMEPDVRIDTNRLGFCHTHYGMLLKQHNRLGVALMLESHLAELQKTAFSASAGLLRGKKASEAAPTCFVCREVDRAMERMLSNICRLWETERDFRLLFDEQSALCLPHYRLLIQAGAEHIRRKDEADFRKAAAALAEKYMTPLKEDVSHFCQMFDYRNSGENADWGTSRDSLERTVWFLTSREP